MNISWKWRDVNDDQKAILLGLALLDLVLAIAVIVFYFSGGING